MRLGMIGLGRMGANMARRLHGGGIEVVGYDIDPNVRNELAGENVLTPADSIEDLVSSLDSRGTVWLMLPAGDITQQAIDALTGLMPAGAIIVDGANSNFNDSMRRAVELGARDIEFVDAGVSGGIWGLREGYALMVGGTAGAVDALRPVLEVLAPAPDRGWMHCGPAGSGHYVKMIHNGIEYGLMQAYAEGFSLIKSRTEFDIDLAEVAETWRHGSVVRSWLLDLTADFLANDQVLDEVEPFVADSGEGRWTAIEAIEQGVPTPVMSTAIMMRFASQEKDDYGAKMLAMMRNAFGGHVVKKNGGDS